MHIVLCTDSTFPQKTGVAVTVAEHRRALERLGHRVTMCAPSARLGRTLLRVVDGFPIFVPSEDALRPLLAQADVVHVFTPSILGLVCRRVARELGRPLVVSYSTHIPSYWEAHRVARAMQLLTRFSSLRRYLGVEDVLDAADKATYEYLRAADAVIAPTAAIAEAIGDASPVPPEVIPCATDAMTHGLTVARLTAGRAPTVLYLGRLSREKAVDWLIECLAEHILPAAPGCRMLIAGTGHLERSLKRLAVRRGVPGAVTWLGEVERADIAGVMSQAEVFAYPSLSDTQAVVLGEAAATGAALVIRDPSLRWPLEYGLSCRYATSPAAFGGAVVEYLRRGGLDQAGAARSRAGVARLVSDARSERIVETYARVM